jgi:hypothetical protein
MPVKEARDKILHYNITDVYEVKGGIENNRQISQNYCYVIVDMSESSQRSNSTCKLQYVHFFLYHRHSY